LAVFQYQRPASSPSPGLSGINWKHPLAKTAELEASLGRDTATAPVGRNDKNLD